MRLWRRKTTDYTSREQWFEDYGALLGKDADPKKRDKAFKELEILNQHLWHVHMEDLPAATREAMLAGEYASQSHERMEEARLITADYADSIPLSDDVYLLEHKLVYGQAGMIVIFAKFRTSLSWKEVDEIAPGYYKGFMVKRHRSSDDAAETLDSEQAAGDQLPARCEAKN